MNPGEIVREEMEAATRRIQQRLAALFMGATDETGPPPAPPAQQWAPRGEPEAFEPAPFEAKKSRRESMIDNREAAAAMLEQIELHPGLHGSELSELLGISTQSNAFKAAREYLVTEKKIMTQGSKAKAAYFLRSPSGRRIDVPLAEHEASEPDSISDQLIVAITAQPGITGRQLGKLAGGTTKQRNAILNKLRSDGLIRGQKIGDAMPGYFLAKQKRALPNSAPSHSFALLKVIAAKPGINSQQIRKAPSIHPESSRHTTNSLQHLKREGLVTVKTLSPISSAYTITKAGKARLGGKARSQSAQTTRDLIWNHLKKNPGATAPEMIATLTSPNTPKSAVKGQIQRMKSDGLFIVKKEEAHVAAKLWVKK